MDVVLGEIIYREYEKLAMQEIPDFNLLLKLESPNALIERLDEISDDVPSEFSDQLSAVVTALKIQAEGRKWIITELRETLDQLRVDLQYVLLDLEATRRERDDLARQ
jgi:hypothetical protein|tara:strand:+ start:167 stop:490 length:324 start_codon:yes stop_codon:yes gene_type:complete